DEASTGRGAAPGARRCGPARGGLRRKGRGGKRVRGDTPGSRHPKAEPQVLVPQIEVRPRPDDAARFGLTPGHIRRVTTLLLRGQKVGEIYEGPKRFDVTVWGVPKWRTDETVLQSLPIDTPAGTQVRLMDVA